MASGYLTRLQIDAAENGQQPMSAADTLKSERDANPSAAQSDAKRKADAEAEKKRRKALLAQQANDELSAEELENMAANKRQMEAAEKKRPKSIVEKGRNALRLLTGGDK